MLSFFSSRRNWDFHPLTRKRVCIPPPFLVPGGGTLACGRGGGGVPIRTVGLTLCYYSILQKVHIFIGIYVLFGVTPTYSNHHPITQLIRYIMTTLPPIFFMFGLKDIQYVCIVQKEALRALLIVWLKQKNIRLQIFKFSLNTV
jgi:hypothetical protein